LGAGAFGVVMKGIAKDIQFLGEETIVAVKTVSKLADKEMMKALIAELKIMVHIGQHLNIVNLLGAITRNISKRELLVICEYCCHGSLENFLLTHRSDFKKQNGETSNVEVQLVLKPQTNYLTLPPVESGCYINLQDLYKSSTIAIGITNLISWSFQIARGMDFLASRKFLHGDLAARNVLLCEDNVVKVCDFGLAKSLYKNDSYVRNGETPLPFKWLALESISDRVFSVHSDIWSYGILLWEIFSLAQSPYPGMEPTVELYKKLLEGYRMEKPEFATDEIYKTMLDCWNKEPKTRPVRNH
jgi:FMS-like tyrosine kinase 1